MTAISCTTNINRKNGNGSAQELHRCELNQQTEKLNLQMHRYELIITSLPSILHHLKVKGQVSLIAVWTV